MEITVLRIVVICLFVVSCSKGQQKPSFINFKIKEDSIHVFAKNKFACKTHLFYKIKTKENRTIDFNPLEEKLILSFSKKEKDSTQILNEFNFRLRYGSSTPLKKYDTLYNYALPFLKGKRYKVLQGQNTNFTHKGARSKYAIDFKMNIGQTVCAMKDGVVVAVKEDSNKGGRSKSYLNDGNYVMLYHNDGLFTQYVHLKKDGVIVKLGDSVKKHQPIAYSGNTGMSTEPHLHFGVFKATPKTFISIPYILDSIPTQKYTKGKFALKN
ncbi:M23 family metallopeptidase [Polaribacter septentrionalilitoris]|uniref:M23 family metallopeptidase n=1 Tax=Polaribacter septentrionalilitoris TaxID=2494657 RepID=UPI001356E3D8|nr:M23 family metallopeptidase [Polaribacter septentrionalilitoris]